VFRKTKTVTGQKEPSMGPGQVFYSDREKDTLDESSRVLKAEKILSVLSDYVNADSETWHCLDIGCSGGIISRHLGNVFHQVIGIDVDVNAIDFAQHQSDRANVAFAQASGCRLPFEDEQFDVAVCNHVYEHVPNVHQLLDEIYRILRVGGVCYLACTNKYWLIEPHYRLPFLSWMPNSAANLYLRLTRRGTKYTEHLLSRGQILKLLHRFHVTEYTVRILRSPQQFRATDVLQRFPMAPKIPPPLARLLLPIMPNFVWIIEKGRSR
jgi:2-polyprenyl-3-methyl-5-hydroxy-6-metoxy-1,4-benzoquinol methylase